MKTTYLIFLLSILSLTSCSIEDKTSFRDASKEEVQHFIPNWYKLAERYEKLPWDESVVKLNLDSDEDIELLLILDEWKSCENPNEGKVIAVDYDRKNDKWLKIWELALSGNIAFPVHSFNNETSDIDSDKIQEIPVISETNWCWSWWTKFKHIITMKDGKLVDIAKWQLLVRDWSEKMIQSINNWYEVFESIWNMDEWEWHFDCSRYHVRYYEWNKWILSQTKDYTTKFKYYLEEDKKYNPNWEDFRNKICVTVDTFQKFTDYIRNDAVQWVYPLITQQGYSEIMTKTQEWNTIIQQDVNLRESPSWSSKIIRPIIKGEFVSIVSNMKIWGQTWFSIKTISGETGWISEIWFKKDDSVKSAADFQ